MDGKYSIDFLKLQLKNIDDKYVIHPSPIPEEKGKRLKDLYFKYIQGSEDDISFEEFFNENYKDE